MVRGAWVYCVVLVLVAAVPAGAQMAAPARHTVEATYWPASASSSTGAAWTVGLWGLDYRMVRGDSPWGLRLRVLSGAHAAGTDTFWSADATHDLGADAVQLTGLVGYGSLQWAPPGLSVRSSGVRVGVEVRRPLAEGWAVTARFVWSPSNASAGLTTSSGAATEWSVGLHYKLPSLRMSGDSPPYVPALLGGVGRPSPLPPTDWGMAVTYTSTTVDAGAAGSTYTWSGLQIALTKTF
ncbi:MAG: hypothetical protein QN173_08940 [Armatimonadota bacterium]|nr:hypothetical protein [Armatimonadota bacterium]MDR7438114.1 hypothetical protein [Armatimonadota bacterium]MDR7472212.1 hypothetical protein [Armatimonadota bacterium]MDR7507713.1 hypothetical protein [Armatimonadota bacterium]MDR7510166.1 hypothetical protein [Armatimonadota bacterium]